MTILVSGQGRGSGKTRAVCDIVAQTPEAQWTAIKVSSHGHGAELTDPIIVEEQDAGPVTDSATDTARYFAAGAVRALWLRCRVADIKRALQPLINGNVILESNSAAGMIHTDLIVFIAGESAGSKPSAELPARLADITVTTRLRPQDLERVRRLLYHGP